MTDTDDLPEVSGYSRMSVAISAIVGLAVTGLAYWLVQSLDVGHEATDRVSPTVEGGGVGSGWVAGNTAAEFDFLIALIHAADVIMGAFILVMVFVHWAAFRRLADRMRQPGESAGEAVTADGGTPSHGDHRSSEQRVSTDTSGGDDR